MVSLLGIVARSILQEESGGVQMTLGNEDIPSTK